MKKIFILLMVSLFAVIGCGKDEAKVPTVNNQCYNGAPAWVINGGAAGGMTSVGAAKVSKASMKFTRDAAMANARDEMARNISVKVENMIKDFTQSTGIGDDEVVDKVTSSVSKQVASQTLNGTRQSDIWISPCNDLYILLVADNEAVKNSVKNSVTSSYKNENALWQQFQSQKAQDELNAAIQDEFKK